MSYRYFDDIEPRAGAPDAPVVYFAGHPVILVVSMTAERLMEIVGPFCWAALIMLFAFGGALPG